MRMFSPGKQPKVSVKERWMQVFRNGEVTLRDFTPAELAAVSLQRDAMPPEPGPVLAAVATVPDDAQPDMASAAGALRRLEREGFVRPWPPAEPDGPRPIPVEYPGWALAPQGRTPVALAGDLAIITGTRGQPAWIAEVSEAASAGPDPDGTAWNLLARVYARYAPPCGLLERPARPDGGTGPYVLLRDDRVLVALVTWCGADVAAGLAAGAAAPADADTASLAAGFTRLSQVRVALPFGEQVRVRTLVVATRDTESGDGGQWLLEGPRWERAVGTCAQDLGERLSAIVKSPLS
jgi:hypothetical protein